MAEVLRVAVVGAGSMAREHVRAFAALPDVQVAGIHSRTRERAEALAAGFGIGVVADSIRELKRRTGAELVVVAVPELAANEVARACLREDWAILLEKPAGYDLADAEDIAAAAAGHPRPVMVGLNRRFYSSLAAAKADLDSRDEARFIHIQDQQSFAEARRYHHPEPVVQKFMYANSIHMIDLIRAFGRGAITGVEPILPWRGEETDVVLALVTFDSGDRALYQGLWQGPGPWACSISTPSRRWLLQPVERASYQNAGERTQNPVEPDPADTAFKAGFLRQAEAVVARVRGEPSAAISIADSLETMRLIHRIFGA
jgi:predicted dehydrogenase